ncbi:MAG: hypothetical protein FWH04_08235 [Oscillospiraceae bacterium]|nr:hypothetical protein [Oscillospiraceae bacterium]
MSTKRKIILFGAVPGALLVILASVLWFQFGSNPFLIDGYAIKVDDYEVDAEIYKTYVIQQTMSARTKVAGPGTDLFSQEIDGLPVAEWIEERALSQIVYDYTVKTELDAQRIKIGYAEEELLDTYLSQRWKTDKEIFESNDCPRDLFDIAHSSFLYADLLFEKYSTDNPEEETIGDAAVKLASAKYFLINKYSMDGKIYSDSEIDSFKSLAEEYVSMLEKGTSIDEVYKNHLIEHNDEFQEFRPLSVAVISSDNEEYTAKIPSFVDELMRMEEDKPFYTEDTYHIAVGIRQHLSENSPIEKAYSENESKKSDRVEFDNHIRTLTEKANVKVNEHIIKKHSPLNIEFPK